MASSVDGGEKALRVLVGCEESGVVRRAFRALGHDAWSCDLLPARDLSPFHIQGDLLATLAPDEGGSAFYPAARFSSDRVRELTRGRHPQAGRSWDLAIFHPPCTFLSSSGLHRNKRDPSRAEKTEDALRFVSALLAAPIPRIALENPVGCISSRIRKPDQIIQPHQFGDDASKGTCLWLKGLPPLRPTRHIEPRWVCCGRALPDGGGRHGCANCNGEKKALPRWANQTDSGQNCLAPSPTRARARSETYQGIAEAFAAQWGCL